MQNYFAMSGTSTLIYNTVQAERDYAVCVLRALRSVLLVTERTATEAVYSKKTGNRTACNLTRKPLYWGKDPV